MEQEPGPTLPSGSANSLYSSCSPELPRGHSCTSSSIAMGATRGSRNTSFTLPPKSTHIDHLDTLWHQWHSDHLATEWRCKYSDITCRHLVAWVTAQSYPVAHAGARRPRLPSGSEGSQCSSVAWCHQDSRRQRQSSVQQPYLTLPSGMSEDSRLPRDWGNGRHASAT